MTNLRWSIVDSRATFVVSPINSNDIRVSKSCGWDIGSILTFKISTSMMYFYVIYNQELMPLLHHYELDFISNKLDQLLQE